MATESKSNYKVVSLEISADADMLKANKVRYFSQLTAFPWKPVAARTCGIVSATMGISLFRPEVQPIEVLKKAVSLHLVPNTEQCKWLVVQENGVDIPVPIGREADAKLSELMSGMNIVNENKYGSGGTKYLPVFSLSRGYDHRGSKRLFAEFGIKAEMLGDKGKRVGIDEVVERVSKGSVFMASVSSSVTPWLRHEGDSTHVVLITDVVDFEQENWFYVVDPYSPSGNRAVYMQPIKGFDELEFNGFGTVIYPRV